ncbi:metal ABC transporter permease, partial [Bacillus pumilus]|uniref:metal ABC transporter permease n=1 Tax=Bacillus pumilus TaxID=1408 RepID=UPI003C142475
VTVASLQTVGIILVVAMLITPAATAYLLTDRLWIMIYLSAFFGAVSAVAVLGLSFTYNLSSGASIVLVATILFGSAFILAPKQGILWRSLRSKRKRT